MLEPSQQENPMRRLATPADQQPAGADHHQGAHDGHAPAQSEAVPEADVHHHPDGSRHVH